MNPRKSTLSTSRLTQFATLFVRFLVFVLLLVVPGMSGIACAEELTEEIVKQLAEDLVEDGDADGLSVGFIQGDRYGTYHFGTANSSGARPNNLTVYEIGSISKVFTSLLVGDAAVRGEIELTKPAVVDNKAGIVLPAHEGRQISWLDLCVHRSGLPRLPSNLPVTSLRNPYREYNAKKAAEFLSQHQLAHKPGERQEYSNLGVSVLGYLIAENAKSDYQTLLRERIAKPLGMDDCTITLNDSQKKRLATPHRPAGKEVPPWDFADLPGAGGIRATLRDMMRFAKAQLAPPEGTIGKAIELAWKEHQPADDSGPATGLGWMILADGQTRWHNGETGGSHSMLVINRELKAAVIVLSNTAPGEEVDELAMELITRTLPSKAKTAKSPPAEPGKIDPKRLEGRYQLTPDFIFDVRYKDGHMMVGITNQPTQEVFADSATKWSYRSVDATLEFHLRSKGPAYALTLHQNGAAQRAKRIRD